MRCRRGKNLAWTCGIQHSIPDEPGVKRFVSGAPTRHQSHLAWLQMPALHERRMLTDAHNIGMRRTESVKTFADHILDVVNQLLHPGLPIMVASASGVLDQPCNFFRELT